ncbi:MULTISPECIES: maleylpyruvate isomerase family mycothiol-dependent enzyme [Kitasatospora]|uniref:Maleylpyruvate isomerase n=2 Tax=Kitasatospora TaxID=2063 RepID=A0ABT1ISA8_9ACTN|nr:maleylpyruvate isomerase family mycothiol-dependent enzyme [Kitasatospora paracochleata]MCP2308016.1 maleylpyruvate isomerase [Kitasatospora paracochleata]
MTDAQTAARSDAQSAAAWLRAVVESTEQLLADVAELKPEAVAEPSALPGWTRGHVLAHISRNADSLVNLLDSARTGRDIPQYASPEARDQGIEEGAGRPLDEQLADLEASHRRFMDAAALLPDEAWSVQLKHRSGYLFPAHELPYKRLLELEYHHVDLAAGHTPAHWPDTMATSQFTRLAAQFRAVEGLPGMVLVAEDAGLREQLGAGEPELTVEGPVRALTAWLSGRADGDGLQVHRGGELVSDARTALPELPPML